LANPSCQFSSTSITTYNDFPTGAITDHCCLFCRLLLLPAAAVCCCCLLPLLVCHGPAGLILATLTTNIAANVVAPANAMVNAAPRSLTFTAGGVITALVGLLSMPWKLYDSFLNFLVAYSVVLGPVVGVVLADYYLIRGRQLDIDALFSSSSQGAYWYQVRLHSSYCTAFAGIFISASCCF